MLFHKHIFFYEFFAFFFLLSSLYQRPILISATSLNTMNKILFNNTDINNYGFVNPIMSSTAIPIIFPPHEFLNDIFVDGGISGNILVEEAISYCLEKEKQDSEKIIELDVIIL